MDTKGKYYLGRLFDHKKGVTTDKALLYDPDDLTTHAVVVGMTGSGKTGLCIDLLEEAALNNVPALLIDPKGDVTNTLLHFPNLLPSDFEPWMNPDQARRENKSVEQAAEETASLWSNGLKEWDIDSERIKALQDAVDFAIYTPGSTVGLPVSILASLKAPDISWEKNQELLREKISGTATALMGLVGIKDIDPVRSREHILLSNIFEHSWSKGQDLSLKELILQTQTPPFTKLGVFDIETFFPQKDRFELAMLLNNILASPAFQSWIEGEDLDISSLLYRKDGQPRHSVFYIAHLSDAERMFFVTLLFSAVETWMRSKSGTTSLRAIMYFDEIYGYLPPVATPPSKQPLLRMLKQARAFGVGLVLVTQNPSDIDYKALSNAGTWFVGKLQTETDKERLLDGLEGALSGGLDRRTYDRLISQLGKRVFLLHNVHEKADKAGTLFQTRWAMNYLAGPLTRAQIPALNALVGAQLSSTESTAKKTTQPKSTGEKGDMASKVEKTTQESAQVGTKTAPATPQGVSEYFFPNNLGFSQAKKDSGEMITGDYQNIGMLYRPTLLAQARIRFFNQKYRLDMEKIQTALITAPDLRAGVRWEDFIIEAVIGKNIERQPDPRIRFSSLESPFSDGKLIKSLENDFADWCYRQSEVSIQANQELSVYAGPEISPEEFKKLCEEASEKMSGDDIKKVEAQFNRKLASIETKLKREERELEEGRSELSQRKMEEIGTHADTIIGLFSKRKRSLSTSLTKRRMTQKAKADVEESQEAIEDYLEQLEELEAKMKEAMEEVKNRWAEKADQIEEIPLRPYKKDISINLFGIAWLPYYVLKNNDETVEIPGYTKG